MGLGFVRFAVFGHFYMRFSVFGHFYFRFAVFGRFYFRFAVSGTPITPPPFSYTAHFVFLQKMLNLGRQAHSYSHLPNKQGGGSLINGGVFEFLGRGSSFHTFL